jgi:hypothetical protein
MHKLCLNFTTFFIAASLGGCATTEYWYQNGVSLQKTAADLNECRISANQGGQKVFTARELETPCMAAKGYSLSTTPPKP